MDLGLADKSAFVLGGSSGLGLAIAKCLAEEKVKVTIGARKTARLDQALADVCQVNSGANALAVDLQDEATVNAAERELRKIRPDILICNCGGPSAGSATASDIGAWRQNFDAMVIYQIRCICAVLPAMRENGDVF